MLDATVKRLRLGQTFAQKVEAIVCEETKKTIIELLLSEVAHRDHKRRELLISSASFPQVKTFEDYCFDDIKIPQKLGYEALMSGDFLKRSENLILYGKPGAGKTHMAIAIGVSLCRQGKAVKFYSTAALVNQLVEAKSKGKLEQLYNSIQKMDLLILDEWGYIPIDPEGSKLLYRVIAQAYENKSLIITTNLEFGLWNGIFYDEKLTTAIIDRMVHHSHLVVFERDSWRVKYSLLKQ